MAKIKNVGRGTRRIVGTFMLPGEELELPDALAKKLIGDDDFVITWDEEPAAVIFEVVMPEPVYEIDPLPALPQIGEEHPNLGEEKPRKRGKKK
jgi:hypothetical protein